MMVSAGFGGVRPNSSFFVIPAHLGQGHGRNKWRRAAQPDEVGTAGHSACPPCSRPQEVVAEQAVAHSCGAAHSVFELPDVQVECSKVRRADPITGLSCPTSSLLACMPNIATTTTASCPSQVWDYTLPLLVALRLPSLPHFQLQPKATAGTSSSASFTAESTGQVLNSAHCIQQTQISSNFFFGGPSSRAKWHERAG